MKNFLTRASRDVADYLQDRRPDADEKKQQKLSQFLGLSLVEDKTLLQKVIDDLFPNARWRSSTVDEQTLLRGMRVAHPRYFDRYFQLIVPAQSIRSQELQRVITASRSTKNFERTLRRYLATDRFGLLVEHLNANAPALAAHVDNVVSAIFAMGDELQDRSWYYLGTTEQNQLANLARNCLEQIVDRNQRAQRLISLVEHASGLSMPYHIIVPEADEEGRTKRLPDTFLVDEKYTPVLRKALISKIEALSNSSVVLNTADSIGALLHIWSKWGEAKSAGKWVLKHRENRT